MSMRGKMSTLAAFMSIAGVMLPGDMIHDEAPISKQRDTRAEMAARDAAMLKRMRKQAKRRKA